MAKDDGQKKTRLMATLMDPLNWVLLVLALAFAYYVMMVPYWQNYYLKEAPQVMTMQEYMANPTHPRAPMLRTLGAPPSSIEVTIEGLTVKHIDTDSITLTSDASSISAGGAGVCDTPPMIGTEQSAPLTDIMIAGDNMDLLEISEGQQALEPTLESDQEERFTKEELDALELLKIQANGNTIAVPYVETGELRLAAGLAPAGEQTTLETLADDTAYIQTVNRLRSTAGAVDVFGARLVGWEQENLAPYFIVEDAEGRSARVFYNQRMLSEWRWGLDRLENRCVVVRGRLRGLTPDELRQIEADGNMQALIDGDAIMSPDGAVVISLENPAGALLGSGS